MDIEFVLNTVLNKALCSAERIKQPNSNIIAEFVTKHIEKEQLNIGFVSVSLLDRFMEHTFNCSGSNYVSDIDQPWSCVEFTKEEIKLLEKLQKGIDPEQ